MGPFFKVCLGLLIICIQTLIGARTFFPDAFADTEDPLQNILESKTSILDRVTPEDLAAIAHHTRVTVGVDPNFYPLEMFDERGRYSGMGGDLLQLLKKMTSLDFKPVALADWAATEEKAREGKIDMFMAAAKTGRRAEFMLFTAPYITMPGIIMTRRDSGLDNVDIKKLAGKKVAVTEGYSWHDFLREFHPEINIVPAANTLEALQKVVSGEADAILDYEFNLLEKIQTAGIMQMRTAGKVDSAYGHALAVNQNNPQLFNVVSIALDQITPRDRQILAQKWLQKDMVNTDGKRLEWLFFFISESALLCIGLILYMDVETRKKARTMAARLVARNRRPVSEKAG